MPVYYFHVWDNGELVPDPDGLELPDLDSVREEVRKSILSVLREDQMDTLSFNREFRIADARGQTVMVVQFRLSSGPAAGSGVEVPEDAC